VAFCARCGEPLADGARFCGACGEPVAAAAPKASQVDTRTSDERGVAAAGAHGHFASSEHGRFVPGTRLGSRWRIVALLGRGGMGEVYRADDLQLNQSVALKFLPDGLAAKPSDVARFRNEVRVARQIAHPNVCRVYDIGEADCHLFLSMEYIDGEDLASVLRRMGRPTTDKAIELARQIGLGLAAAHEAGMLHRDLKPANVMIDGRGRARITDFGLAGLAEELTRAGETAGTPAYMAPEQLSDGRVSVKSDLYALGLVYYELFTGRRAFAATNLTELRRLQDSDSITTPSDLARDIDPAVERLILHCMERDPDARPSSAYAVVGALPGGDPLAAALAAGETPSPELVANAGERGALAPPVVGACVAIALAGFAVIASTVGPDLRVLAQPNSVLAVRAADVLTRTGAFATLPKHTAESFAFFPDVLNFVRLHPGSGLSGRDAIYYWRRWSPRPIRATSIHVELPDIDDPPGIAFGDAAVLLDPRGNLLALRAVPPDSVQAAGTPQDAWSLGFASAGLDPKAFTPTALAHPPPATCDTAAAWRGPGRTGGTPITVEMGASRGRLVSFDIERPAGRTGEPIGQNPEPPADRLEVFYFVPLIVMVWFGMQNLRLGRGDWRGATRIASVVFAANMLISMFATRLAEIGPAAALANWGAGRSFGHAVMHTAEIWFAYMALEPYVRRLWPRMLVSWTRLVSGRLRDPLVGRDVMLGVTAGAAIVALEMIAGRTARQFGLTNMPTFVQPVMLQGLNGVSVVACWLCYASSICLLSVLTPLVIVLLGRLAFRHTAVGLIATVIFLTFANSGPSSPALGWPMAIVQGLTTTAGVLLAFRFGLLTGVVAAFTTIALEFNALSFDLGAWYADRVLVAYLPLIGLLVYGAATTLGGKPILGDPLRDVRAR